MTKLIKEMDDVLLEIEQKRKKTFRTWNKKRIKLTDDWAKSYGKRRKPKWTNFLSSYHRRIIDIAQGYYGYIGFATKLKKKKTKKGTLYTLQLYDTVARRLR